MSAPCFTLTGVGFDYETDKPVLNDVSFTLEAGERVAIVGGNGAGKTTFLHILVGLLHRRAGHMTAFGRERTTERDFHEVRRRAGLLFQDPDDQLFCPTVGEDVAFGPLNLGRSRAEAAALTASTLAALGLAGFEERITHKLSGGEKRLVSLAAVLAMEPEVLLLDEPTAGLDEAATERLVAILLGLPQAMVLVCHDRGVRARLSTRTVRLTAGTLTGLDN